MTREAALMRVPAFSIYAGRPPAIERWLEGLGLLRTMASPADLDTIQWGTDRAALPEIRDRARQLTTSSSMPSSKPDPSRTLAADGARRFGKRVVRGARIARGSWAASLAVRPGPRRVFELAPNVYPALLWRLSLGSRSVLDIGTGQMDSLRRVACRVKIGVDAHRPYLENRHIRDVVPLNADARRSRSVPPQVGRSRHHDRRDRALPEGRGAPTAG